MAEALSCWKCGTSLEAIAVARTDECPACRAELHVCRMCRFFDPGVSQACREPVADPVSDKERANFCGYFEPSPRAWRPSQGSRSRQQVEALFRGEAADDAPQDDVREALERLFGGSNR